MISAKNFSSLGRMVLLTFIPLACFAAMKFPEYPTRQVSECAVSDQKAGLKIGLQPMDDPKEQDTYFHTNMTSKGLVPVYVVMQNGRDSGSFLFEKSKITYGDSSAPQVRSKSGEVMATVGAVGVVGAIGQTKMIHASEVQENLLKKEIQSKTLSPGAVMHGFLYVKAPNGLRGEKIHLSIPVTDSTTSETVTFEVTF